MADPESPTVALTPRFAAPAARRALPGGAVVDAALAPLRRLFAGQRAARRRRVVGVLFFDAVGSIATSRALHPADVHAMRDSARPAYRAPAGLHTGRR